MWPSFLWHLHFLCAAMPQQCCTNIHQSSQLIDGQFPLLSAWYGMLTEVGATLSHLEQPVTGLPRGSSTVRRGMLTIHIPMRQRHLETSRDSRDCSLLISVYRLWQCGGLALFAPNSKLLLYLAGHSLTSFQTVLKNLASQFLRGKIRNFCTV